MKYPTNPIFFLIFFALLTKCTELKAPQINPEIQKFFISNYKFILSLKKDYPASEIQDYEKMYAIVKNNAQPTTTKRAALGVITESLPEAQTPAQRVDILKKRLQSFHPEMETFVPQTRLPIRPPGLPPALRGPKALRKPSLAPLPEYSKRLRNPDGILLSRATRAYLQERARLSARARVLREGLVPPSVSADDVSVSGWSTGTHSTMNADDLEAALSRVTDVIATARQHDTAPPNSPESSPRLLMPPSSSPSARSRTGSQSSRSAFSTSRQLLLEDPRTEAERRLSEALEMGDRIASHLPDDKMVEFFVTGETGSARLATQQDVAARRIQGIARKKLIGKTPPRPMKPATPPRPDLTLQKIHNKVRGITETPAETLKRLHNSVRRPKQIRKQAAS